MKPIPWRVQLGAVAAGYAMVLLVAALLVYVRHIQYVNHPADVMSYGGMYAFGDLILGLFIGGLFLIPTLLLVLVIRKSETAYTRYSQTLLGLSLTAPICLGVLLIPAVNQGNSFLGWFCMDRLFASPIVIAGLAVSRLLARFGRAKRLTSYALLVELGTIALLVTLFLFLVMDPSRLNAEPRVRFGMIDAIVRPTAGSTSDIGIFHQLGSGVPVNPLAKSELHY